MRLPFALVPRHWGLSGTELEIAKIKYKKDLTPDDHYKLIKLTSPTEYESARRIYDYQFENDIINEKGYKISLLDLDLKYNRIDKKTFEDKMMDLKYDYLEISKYDYNYHKLKNMYDGRFNTKDYRNAKNDLELEYNKIDAYEHAIESVNINSSKENKEKDILDVELEYNKIDAYEHAVRCVDINPLIEDKEKELLEIEYKYGKIDNDEYHKQLSTLNDEPWFKTTITYLQNTTEIEFNVLYNDKFVEYLYNNEHPGTSEDELIENFMRDLGRKLAVGEDVENGMVKIDSTGEPLIKSIDDGNGNISYE